MAKSSIAVGMVGFGTVGAGVAKILLDNAALIRRRVGVPVELVRIADLDTTRDRGVLLPPGVLRPIFARCLTIHRSILCWN